MDGSSRQQRKENERACGSAFPTSSPRGRLFYIFVLHRLLILDHMACMAPLLSQVLGHQSRQDIRVQEDRNVLRAASYGCPQHASK
jgi:hypothetical protein